ncbi:hypothetical protein RHIZ404_90009 [Rhizobium sp. EC-SD404]|nr:hypothetical protein RHIZ404_90009 [Rhizobium sp. EC-SD404]
MASRSLSDAELNADLVKFKQLLGTHYGPFNERNINPIARPIFPALASCERVSRGTTTRLRADQLWLDFAVRSTANEIQRREHDDRCAEGEYHGYVEPRPERIPVVNYVIR